MGDSFYSIKLKKIEWLLGEIYPLSRDAIIYYEVLTGEMNYFGMSQLRDSIEHIKRAFFSNTKNEFETDMESAFEHLRRGAVESLQRAANRKLKKAIDLLEIPPFALKLAFVEIPENEKLRELKRRAFTKLNEGRCKKSDKGLWIDAMQCFYDVIEASFDIIDMYPSKAEIRIRIVQVLSFIITVVSLGIAVYLFVYC
jgi:hypothetical protein